MQFSLRSIEIQTNFTESKTPNASKRKQKPTARALNENPESKTPNASKRKQKPTKTNRPSPK
jgi:hypothetical protein